MYIYYRICEKQESLSFVPRWLGKDKTEILKKSWATLQYSIKPTDFIFLFVDSCSKDTVKWFQDKAKCSIKTIYIPEHEPADYIHYFKLLEIMKENIEKNPTELHHIANDDYLYTANALDVLKSVYNDGWTGFAVMHDYLDRYTLDKQYMKTTQLCEVFLGSMSHWKTIPSCPGITTAKGEVWQQVWRLVMENSIFHSDSYTWEVYAKYGCVCPIPGVSTHLTDNNTMTPRINWKQIWDATSIT